MRKLSATSADDNHCKASLLRPAFFSCNPRFKSVAMLLSQSGRRLVRFVSWPLLVAPDVALLSASTKIWSEISAGHLANFFSLAFQTPSAPISGLLLACAGSRPLLAAVLTCRLAGRSSLPPPPFPPLPSDTELVLASTNCWWLLTLICARLSPTPFSLLASTGSRLLQTALLTRRLACLSPLPPPPLPPLPSNPELLLASTIPWALLAIVLAPRPARLRSAPLPPPHAGDPVLVATTAGKLLARPAGSCGRRILPLSALHPGALLHP
mmetsp:Transcript_50193/g.160684  ORF Transcript_50193/g.160684 Transcript_50193/m.160684 type:complete len:268 (+) Transcript_50193:132-935(+)